MKTENINIAPGFRLQFEQAQNAYVLLYPEGMVQLNFSAGEILNLCDGSRNEADIIKLLMTKFPDVAGIDADISAFIKEADENGWIQFRG